MSQGRSMYKQIFQNIINSFKPKKYWGNFIGKDSYGTEYYEAPESLQNFNRPSRWFVPTKNQAFDQKIPVEWESWLRHKRKNPPTEEEIQYNILKMNETLKKASLLEPPKTESKEIKSMDKVPFPEYKEYSFKPQRKD